MPAEEPVISARRPCSPKESSTATGLEFVMKKGLRCLVETDRTGGGQVGHALKKEPATWHGAAHWVIALACYRPTPWAWEILQR